MSRHIFSLQAFTASIAIQSVMQMHRFHCQHGVNTMVAIKVARRAACAVAALVAQLQTNDFSDGLKWVVRSDRSVQGKSISPLSFLMTLPPSKTMSGFRGHASAKARPVVLQGERSPDLATGRQLDKVGSLIIVFSVMAPTVRAFHA